MESREYVNTKFKELFPDIYAACDHSKYFFSPISKTITTYNTKVGAVVEFTYVNERNYKLEVSERKRKR